MLPVPDWRQNMTNRKTWLRMLVFLAVTSAMTISFAGCAGGPEAKNGAAPISCALLTNRDLWQYGTTRALNPFMARQLFIRGTPDEFVALRLTLSLAESARVSVSGSVQDPDGKEVAMLLSRAQLTDYWNQDAQGLNRDNMALYDSLERYYIPDLPFTSQKGRYIVVFKGTNPLPRPATVLFSVSASDGESQDFTFPLPPVQK
jgi:hypothetical protein